MKSLVAQATLISAIFWTGVAEAGTVWRIGQADETGNEFALAPAGYEQYLHHDFGWPDRPFIVGQSEPAADWAYVLPGPDDAWAGSGGLAGIRTQVAEILFELAQRPEGAYTLVIDLVDVAPKKAPLLRARVNGVRHDRQLEPGAGDASILGEPEAGRPVELRVPVDNLRAGVNHLSLTILEGSWLLFDQVRLEGPEGATLAPPHTTLIRDVSPGALDAVLEGKRAQPLLVDVQQVRGSAGVRVTLDGEVVFEDTIEQGRTILEVPLPSVSAPTESAVVITVDGQTRYEGNVARAPRDLATPADYVNVFLGTGHSRWMIAPGPWMPYGMVKLSPNNQNSGWQGGYEPTIENVAGFSHIHEWTMAGLLTMPTTGPLEISEGREDRPDSGYRSRIDKDREQGGIGYYRTHLSDYGIDAELTATTRAGLQRYTFPPAEEARILIDLQIPAEYKFDIQACRIEQVSDHRIEGFSTQQSRNVWFESHQDYTVYFVVEFDRPIASFGVWEGKDIKRGQRLLEAGAPSDAGAFAEFDLPEGGTVMLRSAISLVDIDGARKNLETELSTPFAWDFDAVVKHQRDAWNSIFERVQIETPDYREKMRFYSNMYRAWCARTIWSDVDGRWVDPHEQVQQLADPQSPVFGCDAFWNTFWNLNQAWYLITPEYASQWVKSQLALYDAAGWLAKGPAGMEYIPVMVAEHEIPFIVGAYQMGIRDFDAEKAFEAMVKMQTEEWVPEIGGGQVGNKDLKPYLEYGYVPEGQGRASNTFEYAYDDWTVAQMAKALGKEEQYQEFMKRSRYWRNLIDPEVGFARSKNADGTWVEPFEIMQRNEGFTEGNAWQYTWFVPHTPEDLIEMIGQERFVKELDTGFRNSEPLRYNAPLEQYWDFPVCHGNQPAMQVSSLFNYAERPWLTQKWNRSIQDRYYGFGVGDAYLGDEDQGQMSGWFVMSAMGLFQTDGGCSVEPMYEIGSPRFDKVTIQLNPAYYPGKTFTIETRNNGRENVYVQSATLNGEPLNDWRFPASVVTGGGSLVLEMGPEPNENWGVKNIDLAQTIRDDARLDEVLTRAKEVVGSGFNAGDGYGEVWIRDLATFIELACEVHPKEAVRDRLLMFFRFQGEDGNIPDGYIPKENANVSYKYMESASAPEALAHKNTVETDQESSLVLAIALYVEATGDDSILAEVVDGQSVAERLDRALRFVREHRFAEKYGLVWGATTADWGDVQPEHPWGVELDESSHRAIDIYDNALYLAAIDAYLELLPNLPAEPRENWQTIRDDIARNVRTHLWDAGNQKFIPHLYLDGSPFPDDFDENEIYYHGGTAIAIQAGLLSENEVKRAIDRMVENVKAAGAASIGLTLYPPYPSGYFKNTGMGPYGYQNGGDWTWFGGRMIQQLARYGLIEEAYRELEPMLDRVIKNDGFYEWYTRTNEPRGSGTFRGSAGVLAKAIRMLRAWAGEALDEQGVLPAQHREEERQNRQTVEPGRPRLP
jgi:predicted alpha-1,2-mannosidase